MRIYILTLLTIMSSLFCLGQQFEVAKFQQNSSDLTAVMYQRNDLNSKTCALIKVQIPLADVSFEGNVIGDVAFKSGEYWVFLSEGSKNIVVKHDACTPTLINFADYGIESLKGKQTYVLNLNPPKSVVFDVVFKVSPSNAILTIDNVEYDLQGGTTIIPLTAKNHTYMVVAPGYYSQSNMFRVNEQGNNKVVIELDPKDSSTVTSTPQSTMTYNQISNVVSNRIGIYDEERVLNSIPDFVEGQKIIKDVTAKYENEYNKLTADLNKKYDELQKEQATLPTAILEKRNNEITDYSKKIQEFEKAAQQDITKMQQSLLQPWIDKCQAALNIVRSSMGLASTQNSTAAKLNGVDYVDITTDLTNIVLGKSSMQKNTTIGVYDSNRAFNQLPEVVAAQKELADLSSTYEAEYKVLTDNFNKLFNEYQQIQNDSSVPQTIKDRKVQEISEYQKKTEDYAKQATESLQNRQNELMKPLQDKFNAAVSLISSRRGLVSTQESTAARLGGGVNYVDITDEIISMLK